LPARLKRDNFRAMCALFVGIVIVCILVSWLLVGATLERLSAG